MVFGGAGGAEDADLAHVAVGGEDFQGVAKFLEGFVDQLDVAAIGLIAEKLHGVVDDFADHVAVGDVAELFDEPLGEIIDADEIGGADNIGWLGGFLCLLRIVVSLPLLHLLCLICVAFKCFGKSSEPRHYAGVWRLSTVV